MSPILRLALLLSLAVTPAWAQAANPIAPERHVIVASGTASANVMPDQVQISAGVETHGDNAADAVAANSRTMTAIFAAMKTLGIPDGNVRTADFRIEPQYLNADSNNGVHKIVDYLVRNSVLVQLDDPAKAGVTLDALIQAGANESGGLTYTIKDDGPVMDRLRQAAVANARHTAALYAQAAGVTLGRALTITEGGNFGGMAGSGLITIERPSRPAPPIAISVQSKTLSATVTVTFETH